MSSYDLFKELSELDEDLIMEPYKFVSTRFNIFLCIIAANISAVIPHSKPILSIIVFVIAFAVLYALATWFINRKGKTKLINENGTDSFK